MAKLNIFTNDFEILEQNKITRPINFQELKNALDLEDKIQEKQNQKLLVFQETLNELEKMHRHPNYTKLCKKVVQIRKNFDKYINKINIVIKLDKYGDVKGDIDNIVLMM